MSKLNNAWVIIPAYNESERISPVISQVKKYCSNIIVVDDGSRDNTFDVAEKHKVYVLKHIVNMGKGSALKTGCDFALKKGAKFLVAIDADGQHDPDMVPIFLKSLDNNDIIFGYRSFSKNMPGILRFGNNFINFVTKVLYGISLKDTQCGYRAFTVSAYKKIRWSSTDYAMESEMIANAGKHKLKYSELKIKTIYADRYKGTTVLDGVKIVLRMISWRLRI
jgi:UDP-N-acetylglucosamine---dolichyl-phosphate N-acetylglucosaminyltransferase